MNLLRLNPDYSNRVYGLDVFRAVAILFVVMGHGGYMLDNVLPGFPYIRLVDGVELFFVLSGFLIGTILLKQYEKKQEITLPGVLSFWQRRWFRTLPNYYLVLLIYLVLVKAGLTSGDPEKFNWKFFLFLQNFNTYFVDFFWESWSLTIEEWFYIFTPLCLLALHALIGKKIAPKYVFLTATVIFIIFPLLYRINISSEAVDPFWYDVKFRKVVLTRLDAIMFGVLFAWFQFYYHTAWQKVSVPLFIFGIVLMYFFMHLQSQDVTGYFSKTFYYTCMGFSAALLLPFAEGVKNFKTGFGKVMTHISLISYSMYLVNLCLVADVIKVNFEEEVSSYPLLMYGIFWMAVIVFSTLLYKYFEKPVMDMRDILARRSEFSGKANIKE